MLGRALAAVAVAGTLALAPIEVEVGRSAGELPRVNVGVAEAACEEGLCTPLQYHFCVVHTTPYPHIVPGYVHLPSDE